MTDTVEGAPAAVSASASLANSGQRPRNQAACDVCRARKIRVGILLASMMPLSIPYCLYTNNVGSARIMPAISDAKAASF